MGLDAYLYHSTDWEKSLKTEQEIEELDRRVWDNCKGDDSHMTDDAFREYKRTLLEEAEKQGFIVNYTHFNKSNVIYSHALKDFFCDMSLQIYCISCSVGVITIFWLITNFDKNYVTVLNNFPVFIT